jgi:hypothetical protein
MAVFWFGRGSRFPIPATCFTSTALSGLAEGHRKAARSGLDGNKHGSILSIPGKPQTS